MADPYIGEIKLFAGNFPINGWAYCNGQLLPIAENDALFALIGTTYGGDGQTTFGLPDLRGRVPLHQGQAPGLSLRTLGAAVGAEAVTLNASQYPSHTHALAAGTAEGSAPPLGGVLAGNATPVYGSGSPSTGMAPQGIASTAGGGQPHENMASFLAMNYIIALEGIFPQQN